MFKHSANISELCVTKQPPYTTSLYRSACIIPLENLNEAEHLLSSPANAKKLRDTLAKINNGTDTGVAMNIEDIWK